MINAIIETPATESRSLIYSFPGATRSIILKELRVPLKKGSQRSRFPQSYGSSLTGFLEPRAPEILSAMGTGPDRAGYVRGNRPFHLWPQFGRDDIGRMPPTAKAVAALWSAC